MSQCPKCGNPLFKTKRMNLAWLDVLLALIISLIVFFCLFEIIKSSEFHGRRDGKILSYLTFGVVGLVGWIFSRKVKKERFEVDNCTRCDYKQTTRVNE